MSEDDAQSSSEPPENDADAAADADADGALGVSRRTLVVGAAGIGLGSVLGVGYAVLGGSGDDGPRTVEPTEPDEDGEATLGELHYILENSGAENARLDVTRFQYSSEEETIAVTYRTRANDVDDVPPQRQHVREAGQVVRMFAEYVAQNGDDGDVVHARIQNPSEQAEQPDGYLVRREWVEKYNSGEWDGNETLNTVFGSAYTDEAIENASENGSE